MIGTLIRDIVALIKRQAFGMRGSFDLCRPGSSLCFAALFFSFRASRILIDRPPHGDGVLGAPSNALLPHTSLQVLPVPVVLLLAFGIVEWHRCTGTSRSYRSDSDRLESGGQRAQSQSGVVVPSSVCG